MFPPDTSVAQMTDMLLAPVAKQAGASSFLAIPRLVHARFVGPPDYVVAYAPTISVLALVSLLKEHSQQQCQAGAHAPRYWLDCFTGMHHSTEGQLSAQRQAQRLEGAREAAAHGAKGALLLLDDPCAALQQAWTLQDMLWVVKEHGPQASGLVHPGFLGVSSGKELEGWRVLSGQARRVDISPDAGQPWHTMNVKRRTAGLVLAV